MDGADEIGPGLTLIKGGHGAHLREKIVASAAKEFVVIADESKIVSRLGRFPLPVEVIQVALPLVRRQLSHLRLNPVLRTQVDGPTPWITDESNVILDCHCGVIENPAEMAINIRNIVGVVEHDLFLGMATLALALALVASQNGVREMRP